MTVSVIDMATLRISRNVNVGSWFFAACYNEATDKYYCNGEQGVAVVDGATDSVLRQIPLPLGYLAVSMTSIEPESLVMIGTSSGGSDTAYVVEPASDSVRKAVRIGRSPRAVCQSSSSGLVYFAAGDWDALSVVESRWPHVVTNLSVGDHPQSLVFDRSSGKLFVGHTGMTTKVYVVRDRVGLAEVEASAVGRHTPGATVTTGVYEHRGSAHANLLDASGRPVADVRPGTNDLRGLPRGVYFVRTAAEPVRRVVVVR